MKKAYKIISSTLLIFFFMFVLFSFFNNVDAAFSVNDIFSKSSTWFNSAQQAGVDNSSDLGSIIGDLIGTRGTGGLLDAIFQVGNVIFVSITIVLGIKYIFSSVEAKSDIKESLITLSIGAIFYYLAQSVYNFSEYLLGDFKTAANLDTITKRIFSIISSVANIAAIMGVVLLGIKYMFTASEERAELKEKMVPLVIGLALIYSTVRVLSFIVATGKQIIW